ncbi:hypothetical protein [Metabacillus sediminilitoris]|nr:hypothetical protein [Metabacillus sediminilitoris]QGQ46322.1 hypothetical protein GMB29_14510 [Metabacillus sediminilitoris]
MVESELLYRELKRLTDDYSKCNNPSIQKLLQSDIELLTKALLLRKS